MAERLVDDDELQKEKGLGKVRTGVPRLDELLKGGIPFGSNVMIFGPPFIAKEALLYIFIAEGLKKGVPGIFITPDRTVSEIRKEFRKLLSNYDDYEDEGLIRYVDVYGIIRHADAITKDTSIKTLEDTTLEDLDKDLDAITKAISKALYVKHIDVDQRDVNIEYVDELSDITAITIAIKRSLNEIKGKIERAGYYRLVLPLSTLMANIERTIMFSFLQRLTSKCRRDNAVALYSIDQDMHTATEVATVKHLLDGVIQFKLVDLNTFLAVQGVCDVISRDWVEYKYKDNEFIIGSFALDRVG